MEYIDQLKIKGILYTLKDPTVAAQINARIEELIGTAPSNLDTLQELAAAILNDDEALEGIITTLASKTSKEYVDNLFETIQLTPGPQGETGTKGDKGDTGEQGPKGDTGATGATGKSAYEVAVDNGFSGNEAAWLASLVGPQGEKGDTGETGSQGEQGPKGNDGKSAYELYKDSVVESNAIYSFTSWSLDGNTAYGEGTVEVIEQRLGGATVKVLTNTDFGSNPTNFVGMEFDVQQPLNEGDLIQLYIGNEPQPIAVRATLQYPAVVAMTQAEWLVSLKGADGQPGAAGQDGAPGQDGNDGITPHIDLTSGNWFIGDTDTGVSALGPSGQNGENGTNGITPHIDPTSKHWMIGETDTNIIAEGQNGTNGTNGITPHIDPTTGNWFIGETNTGVHAQGETGTFDPSDLEDYATTASVNEALENKLDNIKSIELYNNDETLTIYNAGMDNINPFYISNESIKDLLYKVNGSSVELFIDGESKGTVLFEHTVDDEYDDNAIIFGYGTLKDNFIPLANGGWLYADYSEDDNSIIINPNITVDGNTLTAGSVHNIKLVLNVSYDVIIMDTQSKIGNLGNKVEAAAAVYYTEAEANTYNASLEGALEAGEPLTQEQAGAYNTAITGATKEENDELSEAEANLYNATLTGAVSTSDIKTPAVTAVPYTNVGEAISDIKTQLGGISIVKISQSAYTALQVKDPSTLYIVVDD